MLPGRKGPALLSCSGAPDRSETAARGVAAKTRASRAPFCACRVGNVSHEMSGCSVRVLSLF